MPFESVCSFTGSSWAVEARTKLEMMARQVSQRTGRTGKISGQFTTRNLAGAGDASTARKDDCGAMLRAPSVQRTLRHIRAPHRHFIPPACGVAP